jgi:ABC-2 type transport system permease protein
MIETGRQLLAEAQVSDVQVMTAQPALETRTGAVFARTLRDNVPNILAWGLGYALFIAIVTILYPALQKNNTLLGIVNSLGLLGAGRGTLKLSTVTSFPGYLSFEALGLAPLVLAIYLIPQALGIVSREEERGTLDLLLSTPISRWRYLTEKVLAIVVSLAAVLLIMGLSLVISVALIDEVDLPLLNALAGIWAIFPISLVILMSTLLISVLVRPGRTPGGLAALFVIVSYFTRALADVTPGVPWLETARDVSIFNYYRSITTLSEGFQPSYDLILFAVAAALFALALWQFQRRDVGV